MNRSYYFDYVEEKLCTLAVRIGVRSRLNVLNLNLHAENFYVHLFNELFGLSLVNANAYDQNATAIDLVDALNKIIIQVSSTATKQKIESALSKDLSAYEGYRFRACKNFCVNGHLAGDCRAPRSDDGRSKESSTQGIAGQPVG